MDIQTEPFLLVVLLGSGVIAISFALDILWAHVVPLRWFYYTIRAPGVIVHECSHILGCIITGAKIKKVVFFSEEGGSVTYTSSKIPYIGDVVISTAPLVCIPIVLAGLTWIFSQYLGVFFPPVPIAVNSIDTLLGLVVTITTLFTRNLIVRLQSLVYCLSLPHGHACTIPCPECAGYEKRSGRYWHHTPWVYSDTFEFSACSGQHPGKYYPSYRDRFYLRPHV